jgi:acetyltransferase-like isoleucine patch superfamily enzyme
LKFTNFLFQRLVGLNRGCPWPVHFTSTVTSAEKIRIHPSVRPSFALSGGCYVQGLNGIEIGADTIFAPGVRIISANHDLGDYDAWVPGPPIRIGAGCWIGANAVILPGVQLGDRVVVGAGAVVTRSFGEDSIIGGVPAKRLGGSGRPAESPVR